MSGVLLNYPLKANTVADDIESFYHVLSLFALRFHHHKQTGSPDEIKDTLDKYDSSFYKQGMWAGGNWKTLIMKSGDLPAPLIKRDAFSRLVDSLAAICKSHYEALDEEALTRLFALQNQSNNIQAKKPQTSAYRMPSNAMIPDDDEEDEEEDEVEEEIEGADAGKSTANNDTNNAADTGRDNIDNVVSHFDNETRPTEPPMASTASQLAGSSNSTLRVTTALPIPLASSSSPNPPSLPLDSHAAFYDAFRTALVEKPFAWTDGDKLDDHFEDIDWSPHPVPFCRGTKRTHDSTYGNVSVSLSHLNSRPDSEHGVQEEDEMPATKRLNTGTYTPRYGLRSQSQKSASTGSGQV